MLGLTMRFYSKDHRDHAILRVNCMDDASPPKLACTGFIRRNVNLNHEEAFLRSVI